MPKGSEDLVKKLLKRIEKLEEENIVIKKILASASPLKCIFKEEPTWYRYYHTSEKFLNFHIKKKGFKPELKENEDIGYLLKIDPSDFLNKR